MGAKAAAVVPVVASRTLRKDAARNRELLIGAAREVFAQRGLEASLDDVAHHAGLGVGTAYRHFANKRELASALIEQAIDALVARAEHAGTVDDPWLGLVGFLESAIALQAEDRGLREVFMGLYDQDQLDAIHERISGLVDALITRAKRAGVIRADAESSDIGFVMTMLCAVAEVGGEAAPDIWRRYLAMALEGLKPGAIELPVAPLSEPDFRKAMASHKLSVARPDGNRRAEQ
ncbi:MAG: helix-turn-helix domain-containing protein [Jatrophihabitantaceae bacterium]